VTCKRIHLKLSTNIRITASPSRINCACKMSPAASKTTSPTNPPSETTTTITTDPPAVPTTQTDTANTANAANAANTPAPSKPRRPKARALTRDEVIEIRALKKYAKWTYEQIKNATGFTQNQIHGAFREQPRYKKRADRWTVGVGVDSDGGKGENGEKVEKGEKGSGVEGIEGGRKEGEGG